MRRRSLLLVAAFLLPWAASLAGAEETFRWDRLSIVTSSGEVRAFRVEIAETPRQRSQGLQLRRALAPDTGMLFDFETVHPVAMWMKNTFISLDMLFLDRAGIIVHIARNTQPQSLRHISPGRPVRGVLEVNAGTAARLRIKVGDRVLHGMFGG